MTTVTIDVDVSSILEELLDDDLIEELECRGYTIGKELNEYDVLDREDLNYLLQRVDDTDNVGRDVYEKLRNMRFGQ